MFSQIKTILVACIIVIALSGVFQVATAATEEEMRTAMQGFVEALNAHDVAEMSSYWTDDVVYDFVPQPPPLNGKQEVEAFFEALFQGIPDFHGVQTRILVSDNIMVTEAAVTGTHSGELSGIPATGSSLQLLALHIWEFEGDKIKRATEYVDTASTLMQMGLMPAPDLDPALLVPSFAVPDAEPNGLTPLEAFQELLARWNAQDLPGFAKMIHPDAEIFDTGLGIPVNRDAYVAAQEMNFQGFSDMRGDIVRVIDMGDGWILREVLFTGTNDGPFMGMPATRRACTLRAAGLLRFDADGLVTNFSLYYDNLTMLAQLGLFPPPDPEANKAVVERWLELWNTQDLAIADEIFAPDFIPRVPQYPNLTDVESYKAEVTNTSTLVPDFHATLEDIIAEGNKVVARFTATGTAQGEVQGIPIDGVRYTNTWIIMFRFANGKIAEEWWQFDMLGVMEQWGMMSPTRNDYTWGAPSEVTGDPGGPVANTSMVLYYVQKFWNEQNVAGLDNTHSPDFIGHIPVIPGNPLPLYVYKQVGLLHMAAFPDLRITIDNIIAEGDKVAARWTGAGTHLGELMGIPASGRPVSFTGMTIHRFADGKIVENWWAYDALGMMQQITAPRDSEPPQE
jgi:steroid delta-isomerase-like uncharacterized protein